jgi:tetratricopeptide (TPR) repeat protein
LVAWLAFLLVVGLPSIYYRRLHKAADWYRWTEVLSLVDTLDQIGKFHFIKLPPAELARFRAKALAGSGRLSEALAEYACFENQPGCPTWLYLAMVAGIYDTAKQHDKAVEFTLKSIRENPRPTIYIDLANRYARYQKNPSKAREALAEAEKSPLVDLALPFQHRCRGIVAFLEGDDSTARLELETSLRILQKAPNLPFRDGTISVTKAYLCRVLSRQGDQVAARKYLAEAKAYLVATGEDELLEACQRDTGLMTSDNAARIAWKP